MSDKIFADTNIIVYTHSSTEKEKQDKILEILDNAYVTISVQVIREFISVMVNKFEKPVDIVGTQVNEIVDVVNVVNEDLEVIKDAMFINQRYKYRFYDSLIIAAALKADCNTLLSEDMHHGQVINDKLTIVNPFI
jgi:predicted nucleic acid-binding protein